MESKKVLAFVLACIFFGSTLYAVHATAFSALLVTGGKPNTFETEPFAEFDASPNEGEGPLTVLFTAGLRNSDAKLYEYDYDGDGKYDFAGEDYRKSFTYENPGTYVASLRITDTEEKIYEKRSIINITEPKIAKDTVLQSDTPSGPTDPWEEEGIQPYKHYFKNLEEYVDTSTGYLTIKQTDLYLPGRGGLDLTIQRIYNVGAVFHNDTPKSMKFPWADLGNGWMLDFPYIEYIEIGEDEEGMCPGCNEHDNDLEYEVPAAQPIDPCPTCPESEASEQIQTEPVTITGTGTATAYLYYEKATRFMIGYGSFINNKRSHFSYIRNENGSSDLFTKDGKKYHFDAYLKLRTITDKTGNNTITFFYNAEGKFDRIVDTLGRVVTFSYSGGKLVGITSGTRMVTYSYIGDNLISSTDPAGRTTLYEYNNEFSNYLLTNITYPTAGSTKYTFKKQPMGTSGESFIYRVIGQEMYAPSLVKRVTYNYIEEKTTDGSTAGNYYTGKVTNTDLILSDPIAVKQTVNYTIDPWYRVQMRVMKDGQGNQLRKTTYTYNGHMETESATEFIGNSSTPAFTTYKSYDSWGNIIAEKDSLGHSIFYSYSNTDSSNIFKDVNGLSVTYFTNSFYTNNIDPNVHDLLLGKAMFQEINSGNKMETYHDYTDLPSQSGYLVQTKTLHNGWILKDFTSDAFGNIISVTEHPDSRSITTTFSYDPQYQAYLTGITKMLNGSPVTSSFSYDFATGDVVSITDMKGYTSSYAYDILGRITSVTFHDGKSKTAFYDDSARIVTITDERGAWIKKYFDELGRMTMVQNAEGQESYLLNYMGKVLTKTDLLGRQYAYEYDSLGRTTKAINPDGTYQQLVYDDPSFTVTSYDEKGNRKDYLYDYNQQLKSVKEYVGSFIYTTSYTYDGVGNMKSVTDAKNQTTSYTYDDLNRLTKTAYADGSTSFLTYDNAGNILSKKDQKNQVISYNYDEMYRLARITYPDGNYVSYAYDNNGNRLVMTDPASQTAYAYDIRNRLISETKTIDGVPYTTNYGYDDASNLSNLTYPDEFSLAYGYDSLNRVSQIPGFASYAYNPLNQITNVTFANGVQTSYAYDARNRPTKILTQKDSNAILDLNYAYDNVGNILTINEEIYGYDELDRLTSVKLPLPQPMMNVEQNQGQQYQMSLLSETASTIENPDGTNTATLYAIPVNFNDNGVFRPIDLNIVSVRGAPYEFQNTSNTFKSYFKSSTNTETLFKFEAKNRNSVDYKLGRMVFGPKKGYENPKNFIPVVEGNTILYPNVYSGVDIKYEITPTALKESIILRAKPPLKKETLDFEGTLRLNNVYFKEEEGSYVFYDNNSGQFAFYIPKPYAIDAEGKISDVPMNIRQIGTSCELALRVPQRFLSEAKYPVIIDPSFYSEAGPDGFLSVGAVPPFGSNTSTTMLVGKKAWQVPKSGGGYVIQNSTYRSFVSFDTSSLPDDATILSSALFMKTTGSAPAPRQFDNLVYRVDYGPILNSWDWDAYLSGSLEGNILSTQNFVTETFFFLNVNTSQINKTGKTQYTIKSGDETDLTQQGNDYVTWYTGNTFSSSAPYLQVTYSRPPSPTNLQVTTPLDDATPTFVWSYQDPEGDVQISFQFQIASDSQFLNIVRDSGEVSSSAQTYTENNALQPGAYYARVKVKESKGLWSGWSSALSFSINSPPSVSGLQITTPLDDITPTFTWTYTDLEGDSQAAFKFQIATDNAFTAIIRDTGEISSTAQTYTENNPLETGTYFARVKVKDNKGIWGVWSDTLMFSVATPILTTYEYDPTGNRTKKNDTGVTTTYNYNNMNQLISMTENGVTTNFTYDANGNLTQKIRGIEWWKYYYDFENRLTKVENFDGSQTIVLGQYYYDGDGKRIKKVESSQATIYIYLGWNIIYEKEMSTNTITDYIFGPNGHIAKVKGGTKYYYHSDHLGSLKQETDADGNTIWSSIAQYEPFGELRSGGAQNEDGYFYTGKLRDSSTGLYYYIARFYDPSIGRFITADSHTDHPDDERLREKGQFIEKQMASLARQISKQVNGFMFTKFDYRNIVIHPEISIRNIIVQEWSFNPQNANRYVYVRNNPIKYIDPSGHDGGTQGGMGPRGGMGCAIPSTGSQITGIAAAIGIIVACAMPIPGIPVGTLIGTGGAIIGKGVDINSGNPTSAPDTSGCNPPAPTPASDDPSPPPLGGPKAIPI